jgi:hypothetical protein
MLSRDYLMHGVISTFPVCAELDSGTDAQAPDEPRGNIALQRQALALFRSVA